MKTDKDVAMEIWEAYFGSSTEVVDPFGYIMHKGAYGNENSSYKWDIDHIWPLNPDLDNASDGANTYQNVQPLSMTANEEKANKLQGKINDVTFAIKKVAKHDQDVVGRMMIKNENEEWVWAYELPIY